MNMIIEQTPEYPKRMIYHPESNTFTESEHNSLLYNRKFPHPYGWIKESGTPPCIADGEGWFGKKDAVSCYEHCERTL